jgi:putative hemolysin
MWGVELVVMLVMVAFNSVFAAYELALASIGLARLDTLVREKRPCAASALRMKRGMEASLAVVQLGITLVGVIAAATGGAGAEESIEPMLNEWGLSGGLAQFVAITLVVIPLTVVTILLGELVPKVFALRNTEFVCLRLSPIMEWFAFSVWPIVWFFEKSVMLIMHFGERRWKETAGGESRPPDAAIQELRALAALARTSRLIGAREERVIVNAARLASIPVRSIMLPGQFIRMLDLNDSLTDALIAAHQDMHTRFPVAERRGDAQQIIGYVNFKDIVAALRLSPQDPSLRGIVRPIPSVSGELTVSNALERMIQDHQHIMLVRSPAGGVVGMITLEDVLEELLGDIRDEYDRLPTHITPVGRGWIVGGNVSLSRLEEATGIRLSDTGTRQPATVNEWVVERLGGLPRGGESLDLGDSRVSVRKVRRQSVLEAHVGRAAATEQPVKDEKAADATASSEPNRQDV